ncbi:hypothetical protein PF005_g19004 [Phytophthora fragariae]|uniref:Uncharacterized protein n=1 Tax=Phytophthora fragariae TaxID=53985 RepID=A0A6A3SUP4_9STRA|nr:hypothetical protein PF003_g9146 [Phytophthora fragariae]KAE8935100.1 hypothetical protein PF009_g14944 [Phytophthora fragariae]KAE9121523.1 hypothetical protein PF006_g17882 [Phytophthora fragariae]KAE9133070.1 hypothetical protein PF007_g3485 [Phytophthora fragariae]KAE9191064.1 hypothetical protein PF005_g19004 [Phytophthora fragariae]
MQASYALELHALKAELQSTLARLGLDPVSSSSSSSSSSLHDDTPPSTTRITRWNRRQLTREVAAASVRRRELERQLQTEMRRDQQQEQQQQQEQEQSSRRRAAWHAAIAELQQQRADILRQMEQEAAATEDTEEVEERAGSGVVHLSLNETQYSIGGVVTLESLPSAQRAASARTGVSFRPAATGTVTSTADVAVPEVLEDTRPRRHFRNTPDALNDVFSLQLKFAETMLKLEKSVQMRDQLLHGGTRVTKRRVGDRARGENETERRRSRPHRKRSFGSGDASVEYRERRSDESFSSSAYSFSSLDSTPRRGTTIRVRYPNFAVSRATTAETLAPSSSGVDYLPGLRMNGAAPPILSTNTTLSQEGSSPDTLRGTAADTRDDDAEHAASRKSTDERQDESHRTPTTGSSVTTPTTGSDQKSAASSTKQVRFGDDAYSTPVLARKFNFDGLSIDEDEDEEKEEESSVLSFLGGSSVISAELNDASFLRAFQRFRRELNVSRHGTTTQQQPLARKLFPAQNMAQDDDAVHSSGDNEVHTSSRCDAQDQTGEVSELEGLGVDELQERRRQLCLDIQAASAQLVLNIGGMQSVANGTEGTENTKSRLLSLRDELKAVDARLVSAIETT